MADALVRPDLHLAADVGGNLSAEVTLDLVGAFDVVAERDELVVGEVLDADVPVDTGLGERLRRASTANAVDVGEGDFDALIARNVDSGKTGHDGSFRGFVEGVERSRCPGPPPEVSPAASAGW